jgi:hypothetical protein
MLGHALRASRVALQNKQIVQTGSNIAASQGFFWINPSTAQVGDLVLAFFNAPQTFSATLPTVTTPSGWTRILTLNMYNTSAADSASAVVFAKILTSSGEIGATVNVTVSGAESRYTTGDTISFRLTTGSVSAFTAAGVTTNGNTGTLSTPSPQTITSSGGTAPLLSCGYVQQTGGGSYSVALSPVGGISLGTPVSILVQQSSPVNVTSTMTRSSGTSAGMASFYVNVS